jgi:hypothetical protein
LTATTNPTLDDENSALRYIKSLDNYTPGDLQIDSPFILQYQTNWYTYHIQWFKDNHQIYPNDRIMETISDGCTHVLK